MEGTENFDVSKNRWRELKILGSRRRRYGKKWKVWRTQRRRVLFFQLEDFWGSRNRKISPNRSDLGIFKERNKGNWRGSGAPKEGRRLEKFQGPKEEQLEGTENFGVSKKKMEEVEGLEDSKEYCFSN